MDMCVLVHCASVSHIRTYVNIYVYTDPSIIN